MLLKFYIPLMLNKRPLRVENAKLPAAHTTASPGKHTPLHFKWIQWIYNYGIFRNARSKHTCNVIRRHEGMESNITCKSLLMTMRVETFLLFSHSFYTKLLLDRSDSIKSEKTVALLKSLFNCFFAQVNAEYVSCLVANYN